jgi:hypothetical protein
LKEICRASGGTLCGGYSIFAAMYSAPYGFFNIRVFPVDLNGKASDARVACGILGDKWFAEL